MKEKSSARLAIAPDNVGIYYWVTRSSSLKKEPIVMHPGSAMNHTSLETLEKGFNDRGHPTIVFDHRGTGYSEAPTDLEYYSLDRYSSDLQAIIEKEGLEKPILYTHSFGFMIGADYAARTGNIGKMIATGASHKFSDSVNPLLFSLFGKIQPVMENVASLTSGAFHKLSGIPREYNDQNLLGVSDGRLWLSMIDVPLREAQVHVSQYKQCSKWDVSDQLKSLKNTIHLVYGKQDSMVRPYAGEKIASLVMGPCTSITVKGTHSLPTTYPQRILDALGPAI